MGECDASQAFGGDLGAVLLVYVMQLAPGMRPATGQRQGLAAHAPGFGQCIIAGVAVRRASSPPDCLLTLLTLQDALEARQDVHRMAAMAPQGHR